jgi:hypothetical protein
MRKTGHSSTCVILTFLKVSIGINECTVIYNLPPCWAGANAAAEATRDAMIKDFIMVEYVKGIVYLFPFLRFG